MPQLRMNQEALRKHRRQREDAQEGSRKRLREGIESGFVREKLLASIHASATNITSSILPKFKVGLRHRAGHLVHVVLLYVVLLH